MDFFNILFNQKYEGHRGDLIEQLFAKFNGGGGGTLLTVTGNAPLVLANALAKAIKRLLQKGKTEQHSLPEGYTQLDYVESDGSTGYVDTGYVFKTFDLDIECDAQCVSTTTSSPVMVWGFMGTPNSLPRWGLGSYTNKWLTSVNATALVGTYNNDRHKFVLSVFDDSGTQKYKATIDGTELTTNTVANVALFEDNTLSSYLFARNNYGTAGNFIACKLYSFKVTKAGVLIHDLVPCKNPSNVIGFYDLIDGAFLAGTGTLTAGSDATPTPSNPQDIYCNNGKLVAKHESGLPTGYTLLESVHNQAASAWVDTGIKFDNTTDIEMEIKVLAKTGSWYLFQSRGTSIRGISGSNSGDTITYNIGASLGLTSGITRTAGHVYIIKATTKNGVNTLYVKDLTANVEDTKTSTDAAATATDDIGIFGNGSNYVAKDTAIYYAKMWKNGELVLDAVPATNASNVDGFYDRVTGNFLTATTGSLVEDATVSDPIIVVAEGAPEVLYVCGKNLDGDELSHIGYTSTGGTSTSDTFAGTGRKIPCNAGEKYTVSFGGFTTSGISGVFVNTWKTDGTFNMRQAISSSGTTTYQIPAGVGMVNFTLYKTGGSVIDDTAWLQVELGASATDYVPYVAPQTASAENLLQVGTYADEQDLITGEVTRKVGVKVLTGEETIGTSNACFTTAISYKISSKTNLSCTHFSYSTKTSSQTEDETIISFASTNIGFRYDACAGTTAFKAWLKAQYDAGTPVIVLYPLAEDVEESVSPQPLQTTAGGNTIIVTAEVSNIPLEVDYIGVSS